MRAGKRCDESSEENGLKSEVPSTRREQARHYGKRTENGIRIGGGKEYGHKVDETRKRIEAEKRESLTATKTVPNEDLKELYVRMAERYTPREL